MGSRKRERGAANQRELVVIVLVIYNTGSGRSASFLNHSLQITFFLTSWKILKNTFNLNNSYFSKTSSQEISFYFCHTSEAKRLAGEMSFCGCGAINLCFLNVHVLTAKSRLRLVFSPLTQNVLWNLSGVKHFNKTYCTSPAPFTFCFSLFLIFQNVLPAPVPLRIRIFQKTWNSLMCIQPMGNQWFWGVQMLFLLSWLYSFASWSRIANEFLVSVRVVVVVVLTSTLRCPEVGLEFLLLGVQRLD